jgi:hypothetical protein
MGLAISRKIAERHGGSLALDTGSSRTRFVLRLPRRQQPSPAEGKGRFGSLAPLLGLDVGSLFSFLGQ